MFALNYWGKAVKYFLLAGVKVWNRERTDNKVYALHICYYLDPYFLSCNEGVQVLPYRTYKLTEDRIFLLAVYYSSL